MKKSTTTIAATKETTLGGGIFARASATTKDFLENDEMMAMTMITLVFLQNILDVN